MLGEYGGSPTKEKKARLNTDEAKMVWGRKEW